MTVLIVSLEWVMSPACAACGISTGTVMSRRSIIRFSRWIQTSAAAD